MPKVEFKRVETDEEVENINIKDGQLIYSKTGKTFMDYGNERIPTGSGGGSVEVDTEMSDTSENAVQNKVIKQYVDSQTVPEEVIISDTQPTDPDVKLWIDTGEIGSQASEITNEYSTSTGLGYSANYVNNLVETIQIQSTIEFTSYQSIITNNTLGVDDCTDYIWYVQPTGQSWEYMPIISQVTSSQILLRCWKLNGTGSANVSLLNSASILLLITGIKKI